MIRELLITKYDENKGKYECRDKLAVEKALTLAVNEMELVTLLCSPGHYDELALGYLLAEGILQWDAEVELDIDQDRGLVNVQSPSFSQINLFSLGKRTLASGCGKGTVFYNLNDHRDRKIVEDETRFKIKNLQETMLELQKSSLGFFETGGVHSAGIMLGDGLVLREDIGRHNAVDKLLGYCFRKRTTMQGSAIFISGRISSEIVLKAARGGISLLVSRSAPTTLAVELAQELGITLAGFVRGKRANIYSHSWRIEP